MEQAAGTGAMPGSAEHRRAALERLLDTAERSVVPAGFAWLDDAGRPMPEQGLQIWINARMTYVFALAHLLGRPGAEAIAAHGVVSLMTTFRDDRHGGWYHRVSTDGAVVDGTKSCYDHSFVLLAAATAVRAGIPGAPALLAEALEIHERYFWDFEAGACRETWSADWQDLERYRGANSNMHTVEAYLVAADATDDPVWRERAASIVDLLVTRTASAHQWRLPEHYDEAWSPLLDYHVDRPRDPFRPYGSTPGHGFEWSRLLLQLGATLPSVPAPLIDAARSLFDRALADTAGGRSLLYTTDWNGLPIVTEQFHWVLCEAILAADALARRTGQTRYADLRAQWWQRADEHFIDHARGSWRHELDADLNPSATTWRGRPDAYHAVNALALPDLQEAGGA